jgi:hypothetical protein
MMKAVLIFVFCFVTLANIGRVDAVTRAPKGSGPSSINPPIHNPSIDEPFPSPMLIGVEGEATATIAAGADAAAAASASVAASADRGAHGDSVNPPIHNPAIQAPYPSPMRTAIEQSQPDKDDVTRGENIVRHQ